MSSATRASTTSDTPVGRVSRISTTTPRPSSAIMRIDSPSTPPLVWLPVEHVAEDVDGVHAHQHRFGRRDVALHQRDMLGIVDLVDIDAHLRSRRHSGSRTVASTARLTMWS